MNLVFIGLPGSGKTTLAKKTAKALNLRWYDSDVCIEERTGKSVPDIFARHGEERFRELETACLEELCALDNVVLSVGGGAVMRNGPLLKRNARVVYLRRSVEDILKTLKPGTRPLLTETSKLQTLKEQREPVYEALCDITIDNTGTIADSLKKILEVISYETAGDKRAEPEPSGQPRA